MTGRRREARSYLTGLVLSAALSGAAFAVIWLNAWSRTAAAWSIGTLAVVQLAVQLRLFLHIDLSRQKREDLQVIMFSALLLLMMVLGTVWIMTSLATRMH